MPYPAGSIAVVDARLQDISGGMQWYMQDADDIRFLAVSGTLTVGASRRARYDFTLVEYSLHIDETPWLIFSTLNNALELEFAAEFWDIVNKNRKERWGFMKCRGSQAKKPTMSLTPTRKSACPFLMTVPTP